MVFYPLEGCREYSNAENPGKFHDTQDGYRTGNAIRQITSWSQSHQPSKQRVRAAIHQFHVGTPGLWQALKQRPKILLLTTGLRHATRARGSKGERRVTMAVRDLIPWNRGRDMTTRRGGESNPFLMMQREMNRLFDDVYRGFDVARFAGDSFLERSMGWPNVEVNETDNDMKVVAELPGIEEKDVQVELANGILSIKGEKKTEMEDKDRLFSERYYGHFERRIPVEDVDEEKVSAAFKNGVLTVTMPKAPQSRSKVKRIAINGKK